ncbi:MAG: Hsp20/alpha crystallin family protein [Burkholderiales bacterium]
MLNLIPWKQKHDQTGGGRSLATQPFERNLMRLRNDFDSLVRKHWNDWPPSNEGWFQNQLGWSFDMEEKDDAYVVRAEVPGFEANDFNIDVRGNYLSILIRDKDPPLTEMQLTAMNKNRRYSFAQIEADGHFTMRMPDGVDTPVPTKSPKAAEGS